MSILAKLGWQIALFVAADLLSPKNKLPNAKASSPTPPTSRPGVPLPVVFGTVKVPVNISHLGGITTTPVHQEYKTGIFSSDKVVIAHSYKAAMQALICHGPVDELVSIAVEEVRDLSRSRMYGPHPTPVTLKPYATNLPALPSGDAPASIMVNALDLFRGRGLGGGLIGWVNFFWGTENQPSSDVLRQLAKDEGFEGFDPRYRWVCHAVFGDYWPVSPNNATERVNPFNFGEQPNFRDIHFVVRRTPSALGLTPAQSNINGGANPAEIIYEILTNTIWGAQTPYPSIDVTSFAAAGATLANEEFGLNMMFSEQDSADSMISEVLRYIDGQLQQDPVTGKLGLSLNRKDYVDADLPVIDESNASGMVVSRPSWQRLVNEVKVKWTEREGVIFRETTTQPVQDLGARLNTGHVVAETVEFLAVTDPVLANRLGMRSLKELGTPLMRASFECTRMASTWRVGTPFKINWPSYDLGTKVFRVSSITYGANGEPVSIDAVEDIFALDDPMYFTPMDDFIETEKAKTDLHGIVVRPTVFPEGRKATLRLNIDDPKNKIIAIEFSHRVGDGEQSEWVEAEDYSNPMYSVQTDGAPATLFWRVRVNEFEALLAGEHFFAGVDYDPLDVFAVEESRDPEAGTITYRVTYGPAVEVLELHYVTIRQDHNSEFLPEGADPTRTITREELDADSLVTFELPPPGYITPVRMIGRRVDSSIDQGLAFEFVIDPSMDQPDRISAWRVRVDNETGAVDVRMWGGPKLKSVRWASVTGQTVILLPSDAAVEAGTVVNAVGGLVAFMLPPGTVAYGHEIIFRAAGYLNPGGVGRGGPQDHSDIITAAGERRRPPFSLEEGGEPYETDTHGIGRVRVLNEGGHPVSLWARSTEDSVPGPVWFQVAAAPANNSVHSYAVVLREKTKGGIDFELRGSVDGMPYTFPYSITGFDLGRIPNVSNALEFDDAGIPFVTHDGDVDTDAVLSWAWPVLLYPGDEAARNLLFLTIPVAGRSGRSGAVGPRAAQPGEEWVAVTLGLGSGGEESSGLAKDFGHWAAARGAGGSAAVVYDEVTATASASLQGSAGTAAWRVKASTTAIPTIATVRAVPAIGGRTLSPAHIGVLLSGLTAGDHIYLAALPLDVNGNEGPGLLTAEYVVGLVPATIESGEIVDNVDPASQTVIVRNPSGLSWTLYVRKRVGGNSYPASWTQVATGTGDGVAVQQTVNTIEGHPSQILWLLVSSVNGVQHPVSLESPAMDLGLVANVTSLSVNIDENTREISFSFKADSDTRLGGVGAPSLYVVVGSLHGMGYPNADDPSWETFNWIGNSDLTVIGRAATVHTGIVASNFSAGYDYEAHVFVRAVNHDGQLGPTVGAYASVHLPPLPTVEPRMRWLALQVNGGGSNDQYTPTWEVNSAVTSAFTVRCDFFHQGVYVGSDTFPALDEWGWFSVGGNGTTPEWHKVEAYLLNGSGQTVQSISASSQSFT